MFDSGLRGSLERRGGASGETRNNTITESLPDNLDTLMREIFRRASFTSPQHRWCDKKSSPKPHWCTQHAHQTSSHGEGINGYTGG